MVGAALLSRATTSLRHVFACGAYRQSLDAATVARSLYEHTIHLAWLAAAPTAERLGSWRKADLSARLKADDDAKAFGEQLLDEAVRAQIEADLASLPGSGRLNLADLAQAADDHWRDRILTLTLAAATKPIQSFRGLYVALYRSYSPTAHPTMQGLNRVVLDDSPGQLRVVIEEPPDDRGPFGLATVVYGLGLSVAAQALGWPDERLIGAAFERFPALP